MYDECMNVREAETSHTLPTDRTYVRTYLCVLILKLMEVLFGCLLPPKSPDSGESLKCGREVRKHWTSSYKYHMHGPAIAQRFHKWYSEACAIHSKVHACSMRFFK